MPRTIDIAEKISQLRAFYKQEGRAPSYAEMAELFGYKSKNAVYTPVNKLIALNYLSRSASGCRWRIYGGSAPPPSSSLKNTASTPPTPEVPAITPLYAWPDFILNLISNPTEWSAWRKKLDRTIKTAGAPASSASSGGGDDISAPLTRRLVYFRALRDEFLQFFEVEMNRIVLSQSTASSAQGSSTGSSDEDTDAATVANVTTPPRSANDEAHSPKL